MRPGEYEPSAAPCADPGGVPTQRVNQDLAPLVVIDACVWHSAFVRHVLRHIALRGLLRPRRTPSIESEWMRSIRRVRPDIPTARLLEFRDRFRREFPEGLLTPRLPRRILPVLPDPNDAHVVHAALDARASIICSVDRHGFPPAALQPLGLVAMTPDALVAQLLNTQRCLTLEALRTHRRGLQAPPMTAGPYIDSMRRAGLSASADLIARQPEDLA